MEKNERDELLKLRSEHDKLVEQRKRYTLRRLIKISLLEKKCIEAGIVVTDHEIDVEMKKRSEKK